MTNKYLEKVASITGIELGALAAMGGYAADPGHGNGGAVAGMVGGAIGHRLGTSMAPYAGGAVASADHHIRKLRKLPQSFDSAISKGVTTARATRVAATVAGAYGAARAYSAFKNRNNHE